MSRPRAGPKRRKGNPVASLTAGFPRVQEGPDSAVREVTEPEGCSFAEVVESFGGSVGYLRDLPVGDLSRPAADGAAQFVDLSWAGLVLEVVGELFNRRQTSKNHGTGAWQSPSPALSYAPPSTAVASVGAACSRPRTSIRSSSWTCSTYLRTPSGV